MSEIPTRVHFTSTDEGDWIASYVNGKRVLQGHAISPEAAVEALPGVAVTASECSVEDLPRMGTRVQRSNWMKREEGMALAYAQQMAVALVELLAPACERIEVAGSVRRQKDRPNDIEIVAMPEWVYSED